MTAATIALISTALDEQYNITRLELNALQEAYEDKIEALRDEDHQFPDYKIEEIARNSIQYTLLKECKKRLDDILSAKTDFNSHDFH